jgi:hypothetical protein
MQIPAIPDLTTAVIRTAYGDEDGWATTWAALTHAYPEPDFDWTGAQLIAVEDPELHDMPAESVIALPMRGQHSALVIADRRSLADHTTLIIQLASEYPPALSLRCEARQLQGVLDNVNIGNLTLEEFAPHVDEGGVFRGFRGERQ